METRTSSVVESTGFEGPRDKSGNGVTRRLPVDDPHAPAQDTTTTTTTTTPSDTPAKNGLTDGSADGPVDVSELRKAFRQKYRHVQAVHSQSKPSCLSHDTTETPSFLGFRNLMVIVLVAANLRLVIENIQKYGVLICIKCHDFRPNDVRLGLALYVSIPWHLMIAYFIELVAAYNARSSRGRSQKRDGSTSPTEDESKRFLHTWRILRVAHAINVSAALAITSYVVYYHIHHPLIGTLAELHAIIVWLKTASYALTNRDLRHAYLHPVRGELAALPEIYAQCPYPANVTFSNLAYFWWAPTLVYQPAYPRTARVRWLFVAKRLGEVVCLSAFIWFASAQYAAPVLRNSLDKIATLDYMSIVERLLKLSTISLVIWLAGFFALFQSALNALAEVMRFGDREFYEAWWNSESLGAYWRTWNKPVYQFFRRHVYSPMRSRGWSHLTASTTVFLISAILHELLVGVPTHNLIGVAFLGMFLQLPLIALTARLERGGMRSAEHGRLLGNTIFWVSFTIFGQPFAALMYFYAWQAKYGSVSKMPLAPPTCPAV
ncbi:MBOAT, membrane-bound O-acyltransferase family-domain-containing protein [Parachaetomium inaequale]|uniref:O-acyltransferase n=1 Tax=Parachaetomium inaequale TaxID=2588326 RepID=A0AAN6PHN6_9PEZI|nr:MBOAT, membrane-bound O-acyltransferase family-domain-containing protein [Parachaetomium inaequale]